MSGPWTGFVFIIYSPSDSLSVPDVDPYRNWPNGRSSGELRNISASDDGLILDRAIENDCHRFLRIEFFQINGKVSLGCPRIRRRHWIGNSTQVCTSTVAKLCRHNTFFTFFLFWHAVKMDQDCDRSSNILESSH